MNGGFVKYSFVAFLCIEINVNATVLGQNLAMYLVTNTGIVLSAKTREPLFSHVYHVVQII